uniref:Interleukin 1 receptor like 1 n=1 Tax=Leptobrachium leishanense TaxID=445787 RepID=A0A8C5MX58_9ANUR
MYDLNEHGLLFFLVILSVYIATGHCRRKHARENEAYVLECPEDDENEIATVTWYRFYELIPANKERRVHVNGNKLLFLPVVMSDAGIYTLYHNNGMALYLVNTTGFDSGVYNCRFIYEYNGTMYTVNRFKNVRFTDEPINIPCSVFIGYNCFDFSDVYWMINGTTVADFNSSRFLEEKRKITTYLDQDCKESTLRILKVEEEDFNYNFTCISIHNLKNQHSTVIFKYPDGKTFDAYVIYPRHSQTKDEETEYFVTHILIDVLENKCGYKIYIPGRNNIPGEDVANCALKNLEKSRRLIIILTAEIQAIETLYEQQIGLHNALINNNVKVLIITMGNVSGQNEMQESLRHIANQKGIIKWDKSNVNLSPNCKFWKLVRYHMP